MKPYRLLGKAKDFLKNKFNELEQFGLISPSNSDWATAIMCVPKDSKLEEFRPVQNYKGVNRLTIKDKYPLKLIEDIILQQQGKKFICVLDMKGGFNQILLTPQSKKILAMITPWGLYEPNVMFFGWTNSPSIFQRFVDQALGDLYDQGVSVYIDDIIISAYTQIEMLKLLEQVFIRLLKSNFKLAPEKCTFMVQEANILGHQINLNNIQPKQKKLNNLKNIQIPKSKLELQSYLGSINFYRHYIPDLSILFYPLNAISSPNSNFKWDDIQQLSFDCIQLILNSGLKTYILDMQKPFNIIINQSQYTYSAALTQKSEDCDYIIQFQSCVLSQAQMKLDTIMKEIDCLVWALDKWRNYIQPNIFTVEMHYFALKILYEHKKPNLQLINYQIQLQDYNFEIIKVAKNRYQKLLTLLPIYNKKDLYSQYILKFKKFQNLLFNVKLKYPNIQVHKGYDYKDFDIILQFDGASQNIKLYGRLSSASFYIFDSQKSIIFCNSKILTQQQTNNQAEYEGLLFGLQYLYKNNFQQKKILIQGDSQLVINQLKFIYMCNNEDLGLLLVQIRKLLKSFKDVTIEHIDREFNSLSDSLAKKEIQSYIKSKIQKLQQVQHLQPVQNFYTNLNRAIDQIFCQICQCIQPEDNLLLCDNCNNGYHTTCIGIDQIPQSDWYCDSCEQDIIQKISQNLYIDPTQDIPLLTYLMDYNINNIPFQHRQRVLNRSQLYILKNNILFRIDSQHPRLVPTIGEREILIDQIHALIGHFGIQKTQHLIQTQYYWPFMLTQISQQLKNCILCQANDPRYLTMPGAFPLPKFFKPFQALHFDCLYLPQTSKGYTMVCICICAICKWVKARPLYTNNSIETRNFLFDEIICRYGSPLVIYSDRGPEFQGEFNALCQRLNIYQHYSSAYYPQANGQIERMIRTFKNSLIKLTNSLEDYEYSWDELIPQVLMGIRFTISRATKFSPYQVLFATHPQLPGYQNQYDLTQYDCTTQQGLDNYIYDKILDKNYLNNTINQNLKDMQNEIEDTILKRIEIHPHNLEYGMLVFLKREERRFPRTRLKGPYIFVGYGNKDKTTAIVVDPLKSKIHIVNIIKLSPLRIY